MYQDERNQVVAEAPIVPKLAPYQELLLAAAQYIRAHGWCQGTDQNLSGEVCMRGAVRMAHAESKRPPKDGTYSAAYSRLIKKQEVVSRRGMTFRAAPKKKSSIC